VKKIKYIILTLGMMAGFGLATIPAGVSALDPLAPACKGDTTSAVCKKETGGTFKHYVGIIVNALLLILGAVSVIVIIIAGITYTTSGGDANLVAKAKNTLIYAIVGLVVAILAYPIVNYVISLF
jgi:hypothetical protein